MDQILVGNMALGNMGMMVGSMGKMGRTGMMVGSMGKMGRPVVLDQNMEMLVGNMVEKMERTVERTVEHKHNIEMV
jgi:hypothetical protein